MIPPHSTCADTIVDGMRSHDVEVTASELPSGVLSEWLMSMRCPHGTTMYFAPTTDQLAAWLRDGVR